MSKTTALTPEEWKQLCLLGTVQLNNFVQHIEVPTEVHFKMIDEHVARWRGFVNAWALSRPIAAPEQAAETSAQATTVNGAESPKRKGGWPKGKKRTPKAQPEGVVQ